MKRTNESGRSMVEMLGVLAIIGVLSIGGIAGYTTAMNRYRANEVLDMATKYATIVFTADETHRAMNSGTGLTSTDIPTFCETGLAPVSTAATEEDAAICAVNGAEIKTASISGSTVSIKINFNSNAVCKAAQSSLGQSDCGTGTELTYTITQS